MFIAVSFTIVENWKQFPPTGDGIKISGTSISEILLLPNKKK